MLKLNKIRQVALAANDLAESKAFYQDVLGAEFVAEYHPPGLVFFDFSGTRLLFEQGASPATIYFWVDDIDEAVAELGSKGVEIDSDPHLIFPDAAGTFGPAGEEEWMAFFKDPAGNILALATRKPASQV